MSCEWSNKLWLSQSFLNMSKGLSDVSCLGLVFLSLLKYFHRLSLLVIFLCLSFINTVLQVNLTKRRKRRRNFSYLLLLSRSLSNISIKDNGMKGIKYIAFKTLRVKGSYTWPSSTHFSEKWMTQPMYLKLWTPFKTDVRDNVLDFKSKSSVTFLKKT